MLSLLSPPFFKEGWPKAGVVGLFASLSSGSTLWVFLPGSSPGVLEGCKAAFIFHFNNRPKIPDYRKFFGSFLRQPLVSWALVSPLGDGRGWLLYLT